VAIQGSTWLVDGNPLFGQTGRIALMAATAEQQGVTDPLDLLVLATTPATSGILINPGSGVIFGAESTLQGSYGFYNVGQDSSLTIAATGGSTRSDMVVARVEDPTWSGSPWTTSAPSGQIVYFRVISGVAPGSTVPPTGISAIALARIDMPASTSTVAQAYINDVRQVTDPVRARQVLSLSGSTWSTPSVSPVASGPVAWPSPASWSVYIPSWATSMQYTFHLSGSYFTAGASGTTSAAGVIYPVIGASVSAPTVSGAQENYLTPTPSSLNGMRQSLAGGGSMLIPSSIRGTTQTIQFAATGTAGFTGTLTTDGGATLVFDYEFIQLADYSQG
jgi:hypothetical protein